MDVGVSKKNVGKPPQIIHLFIGFGTMIFTIHFGGKKIPLFLETPMCLDRTFHVILVKVFVQQYRLTMARRSIILPYSQTNMELYGI